LFFLFKRDFLGRGIEKGRGDSGKLTREKTETLKKGIV
jgi:hypothetical protein